MNKQIFYSVLQYKHSPLLGEAINVGVLFYFPGEAKRIYLNITDSTRIKPIYKDFNPNYFKTVLKIIKTNIERYAGDLLAENLLDINFQDYISNYILKDDDTVLQFSRINTISNIYSNVDVAIAKFTELLLPLSLKKDAGVIKHDEKFIIKKFKTRLFSDDHVLEESVKRNIEVKTDEVKIKFEYAWLNGTLNLIHPLSFDLQDAQTIQRKTAEYCSYLSWLKEYTFKNKCRVDLLLARPQETNLQKVYENSIKLLKSVDSNKKVVDFEEIDDYTDSAAKYLLAQ